jgi:uncharacterized membrane protein
MHWQTSFTAAAISGFFEMLACAALVDSSITSNAGAV